MKENRNKIIGIYNLFNLSIFTASYLWIYNISWYSLNLFSITKKVIL